MFGPIGGTKELSILCVGGHPHGSEPSLNTNTPPTELSDEASVTLGRNIEALLPAGPCVNDVRYILHHNGSRNVAFPLTITVAASVSVTTV